MTPSSSGDESLTAEASTASPLVARSDAPLGLKYSDYKPYLRHDFFYSCSYCTMSEAEALAIRFTIDHYEPQKARPDLAHAYENLMYACDECNIRKGDRCPPAAARADGLRFFRPDADIFDHHFKLNGVRVEEKSRTGWFTIQTLDLNRLSLRRLRDYRQRLETCHEQVLGGIMALRRVRLDRLPQHLKGQVHTAIQRTQAASQDIIEMLDDLLRSNAKSPLIDSDPEAEARAKDRMQQLAAVQGLYPGAWRAPRKATA